MEAYRLGYDAYLDGYDLEDNPFDRMSAEHTIWKNAWVDAKNNSGK